MSFLLVDHIVSSIPGKSIRGVKDIALNTPYLVKDEEGRFNFPPSLIGETLGQLAAWNVMEVNGFIARPVAGVVARAQLFRGAFPGDLLRLESVIDKLDEAAVLYHSTAWVNDEVIVNIEGALGPLLPMEEFIDQQTVREQYHALSVSNRKNDHRNDSSQFFQDVMSFDSIIDEVPGYSITAEKKIHGEAPYFPDHFPRKPVLPLTILLEAKVNLAKRFLAGFECVTNYRIIELRKIKMNVFVHPNDCLRCMVTIKEKTAQQLILAFRSEVNQKRVCLLEMVINYE